MLFWLIACVHTNSSKENPSGIDERRPSQSTEQVELSTDEKDNRMSPEDTQYLGRVVDSICRAYSVPEDIDQEGCSVLGPYQGIIQGEQLGGTVELSEALKACLDDPKCTGVATDWYLETPFVPVSQTEVFSVDSNSYGCSFVVMCS